MFWEFVYIHYHIIWCFKNHIFGLLILLSIKITVIVHILDGDCGDDCQIINYSEIITTIIDSRPTVIRIYGRYNLINY